jgi:dephospho-CoA kinase
MYSIAFSGKPRAGKDTCALFATEILTQYGYNVVNIQIAEPLYKICSQIQLEIGTPVVKDRKLLQAVGKATRDVLGDDIWALQLFKKCVCARMQNKIVIVTDLRFAVEKDIIGTCAFKFIRVDASKTSRLECTNDECESQLDNVKFDYIVDNNGDIADTKKIVWDILNDIYKFECVH